MDRQPYGSILRGEHTDVIAAWSNTGKKKKKRHSPSCTRGCQAEHEKVPRSVHVYLHPCCHEELGGLPEIKALVLPDVLHYPNDLQRQHVLPQICGETGKRMSAALISCVMHYEVGQSSDL